MFGIANPGHLRPTPFTNQGNQIRGFGFLHDGSVDTVFRFHSAALFSLTAAAADRSRGLHDGLRRRTWRPIVGQQVTFTQRERRRGGTARRLRSRRAPRRTSPPSCWAASSRSATSSPRWWRAASSAATSSTPPRCSSSPTTAAPAITDTTLRNKALIDGNPVTYTCTPPGLGPAHGARPRSRTSCSTASRPTPACTWTPSTPAATRRWRTRTATASTMAWRSQRASIRTTRARTRACRAAAGARRSGPWASVPWRA